MEKINAPRIKQEYSILSITVIFDDPEVKIEPAAQKPAELKIPNPLVEKIEGPFDDNNQLVKEMEVGKNYIFKATKFKKSIKTPIKHIWFAEQLDDGEITDLEYKKEENPYLDEKGILCYKYTVKECKKVRIYAYVAKPDEDVSITCKVLKSGKAILIAFPEQNPKIPKNQTIARWFESNFGDNNGKVEGAGHAGIVIIDKDNNTKYFDFGRYSKSSLGKLPKDTGVVRSSNFYKALRIPNWNSGLKEEENVKIILEKIHNSSIFINYGVTIGALAKNLDYNPMLDYALSLEKKGYHPFGGYENSTAIENPTYCAKFARGVAESGGFDWSWYVFTGKQNVEDVKTENHSPIIIIE